MAPTETPEFLAWFGNSKVRAGGKPKIVYHGTIHWDHKDFIMGTQRVFARNITQKIRGKTMDQVGIWFSGGAGDKGAGIYTLRNATGDNLPGTSIIPVYLRIENPWITTWAEFIKAGQEASGWTPTKKEVRKIRDPITGKMRQKTYHHTQPTGRWDAEPLRAMLKADGYDGILFPAEEHVDGSDYEVWVAFEPNQIKSAYGNRGTFDPESDHIGEASNKLISTLFEKMALRGSIKKGPYQRLLAASYVLAPKVDPKAVPIFKELAAKIEKQHKQLSSRYTFKPTAQDPYGSFNQMKGDVEQQRQAGNKRPELRVYDTPPGEGEGHPAFDNDTNVMVRGVHDAIAHLAGNHTFSARGEYGAYNRHLKTLPPSVAPALFCEIPAQIAMHSVYGDYCEQKCALLSDFDYFNIGALKSASPLNRWFVLQDKVLQPRQGFTWDGFSREFPELAEELERQPGFTPQDWESYSPQDDPSTTRKSARR